MNEDYLNENSKEFKAAKELEHTLNDYGWNPKQFALATQTFHRNPATKPVQDHRGNLKSLCFP